MLRLQLKDINFADNKKVVSSDRLFALDGHSASNNIYIYTVRR